jgi:hypothetical protein
MCGLANCDFSHCRQNFFLWMVWLYFFFGFDLFWFVIIYYLYQYGNTYFDGMTEQLKRQGETFNYQNRGVWINSQDKTIILFDQPDQRLVKYPFDYITSVGHYNLVEDRFRTTTTVISNPMMGTHVNQREHRTPMKREFQVNIGTRDQFKPNYSLKVLFLGVVQKWQVKSASYSRLIIINKNIRKVVKLDDFKKLCHLFCMEVR